MSLRHHEIAEAGHRILNPFTEDKLRLLGEVTRVGPGTRILDLACGKGELLCRWAEMVTTVICGCMPWPPIALSDEGDSVARLRGADAPGWNTRRGEVCLDGVDICCGNGRQEPA